MSQSQSQSQSHARFSGGCLCGALRYEAAGPPLYAGHCYCADCRKASGSGFIPFLGLSRDAVRFSGRARQHRSIAANGNIATRNFCAVCGSLVFGGETDTSESFTIYAGSLDDASLFQPTIAIFVRDRPDWAVIPPHLAVYDSAPG